MIGLVTLDEYREYAKAVGTDLTSIADSDLESQLTTAMRFINSLDSKLRGKRTAQTQPDAYPRKGLELYGDKWPSEIVPQLAKDCQMAFALEVHSGIDIFGAKSSLPVISESVGPVSITYASPSGEAGAENRESLAMFLLRELMDIDVGKGGAGQLRAVRV